jgi:hypothetical protein
MVGIMMQTHQGPADDETIAGSCQYGRSSVLLALMVDKEAGEASVNEPVCLNATVAPSEVWQLQSST